MPRPPGPRRQPTRSTPGAIAWKLGEAALDPSRFDLADLHTAASRAYIANWTDGQLIAVDLPDGQKTTIATGLGQGIAGVALDGRGKAYVGQL
ncbi:hypothetical protein ACWCQL_38610 [Streptomyces sp. NPDC002073]